MEKLLSLLKFMAANKDTLLNAAGAFIVGLCAVAAAINKLLPHDLGPAWFHRVVDRVALLPKKGMVGLFGWQISLPGLASKYPDGTNWAPPASAMMLLPFVYLGARGLIFLALLSAFLALPGCLPQQTAAFSAQWKTCELGKLPQAAQAAEVDVGTALVGVDWESQLSTIGQQLQTGAANAGIAIGAQEASDQLDCLVEAIVAAWKARAAAVKGQADPAYLSGIRHGETWLARRRRPSPSPSPTAASQIGLRLRYASTFFLRRVDSER